MPMHRIYTAQGLYTPSEKHALSKAITSVYKVLPPFYVVVFFIDIPKESFFIGGEPNDTFARFNVQHFARRFQDKEDKLDFMKRYEAALKPFTADKGLDWEINIDQADQLTWHENGMSPPVPDSESEGLWKRLNKAVPFEGPSWIDLPESQDHL
ncbi:hypothetical protein BDV93DRAFT_234804 [Ceratobasidium sp. AG-I]|nr:hypothetical protein BDV93DRAFT_234804 [Ceratobasidium sp. AG-I]